MIGFFVGQNRFLSNFYPLPDGCTVEHRYQAAKTWDMDQKAEIMAAVTPGQAKRLGRTVNLRPDWEEIKIPIMASLIARKFADEGLMRRLLLTGDQMLVEGNTWHDNTWGNCFCKAPTCMMAGHNWLGVILMAVRAA